MLSISFSKWKLIASFYIESFLIILDYFIEHVVKTITLSTKPSNINAICFYEKFGFKRNGEGNGEEVILQKKLDS